MLIKRSPVRSLSAAALALVLCIVLLAAPAQSAAAAGDPASGAHHPLLLKYLSEHPEYGFAAFLDIDENGVEEMLVSDSAPLPDRCAALLCLVSSDGSRVLVWRLASRNGIRCDASAHSIVIESGGTGVAELCSVTPDGDGLRVLRLGKNCSRPDLGEYYYRFTDFVSEEMEGIPFSFGEKPGPEGSAEPDRELLEKNRISETDYLEQSGALREWETLCFLPVRSTLDHTVRDSGIEAPQILDVVRCFADDRALIALMADGTVRSCGLEAHMDAALAAQFDALTDVRQVAYSSGGLIAVKNDGSVFSTLGESTYMSAPAAEFDPARWNDVERFYDASFEYYGLTRDGRVLVSNDNPDASFGGGLVYRSWTDVAQIVPYAYPESRGLVGLRRDGTVLRADDYYAFNHTPTDAVAIASSGYVVAALNRDGTVFVAGPQTLYSDGFLARAEQLRDVVRIAVSEQCLFALLSDGSVTKCGAEYWDYGLDAWSGIVDIQTMVFVLVGLRDDGRVLFALPDGELDYLSDLRNEASVWEDVVRIEARCPNDIGKPYLLGWTSDGSILAAGLDLTPLL